jgi:hypothetical protein
MLLLHDPLPTDPVDLPEICGYLEAAKQAGYLRAWGIAGEQDPCVRIRQALPAGTILQLRDDIVSRKAPFSFDLDPLITFGILSTAVERISAHLKRQPHLSRKWSEDTGVDCSSPDVVGLLLLQDALCVNQNGVVLYSTTRPERLIALGTIPTQGNEEDPSLAAFRRHVRDDLSAHNHAHG